MGNHVYDNYVFEGSEKSIKELYEIFLKSAVTEAGLRKEWDSVVVDKNKEDWAYRTWYFDSRKIFPMEEYGPYNSYIYISDLGDSDGYIFPKDEHLIIEQLKKSWILRVGEIMDNIYTPFEKLIPKYYPDVKVYWEDFWDASLKFRTNDKKHRFFSKKELK